MAGTTSPDGLAIPTAGDVVSPRVQIAALASTAQAAFSQRQIHTYRWVSTSDMEDQVGMSYGDMGYNEETNLVMIYLTSNQWGRLTGELDPGSYKIVPPSVSGGTVVPNGNVEFSVASSVSLNDVFTSIFSSYRIVIRIDSASVNSILNMQYRVGGVNQTGASTYVLQTVYNSSNTLLATSNSTGSSAPVGIGATTNSRVVELSVNYPRNAARPTLASGASNTWIGTHHIASTLFLRHTPLIAVDGFSISPDTGTITGSISVYGLV